MSRDLQSWRGSSGRESLEDGLTKRFTVNSSGVGNDSITGSLPLSRTFSPPASIEPLVPFVPNLVAKAILEQCTCVDDTREGQRHLTRRTEAENEKEGRVGDELQDAALEIFCTSASVKGISMKTV